jgi:glycosyltransferase involved in cell wall biosynthesis
LKVLLVIHGVKDPTTAVYRNMLGRAAFLRSMGHDAQVLTPDDVGLGHGRVNPLVLPFVIAWFMLRTDPFDTVVFHSHTGWVYQLVKALWPTHRRTRVAVAFHGLDVMYVEALAEEGRHRGVRQSFRFRLLHAHVLPRLTRWSCRRADRVFCMNESEHRFLLRHGWVRDSRLRRMPNCLDEGDFVARQAATGPVRLLMVAQWLPVKGVETVVEAFTAIARKGLDVRLTCAGTRRDAGVVLRAFPDDVRARVAAVPTAPHEDMRRHYAAADIFILPSVFEGFSVALLEAMAAGLAIVTTPVGAAPEILDAGRDAEFVAVGDAGALETTLENLVADSARRGELGGRARTRARAFLDENILPRFVEDLLGSDGQPAARMAV